VDPDATEHRTGDADDPWTARPAEDSGSGLLRAARPSVGAEEDLDRDPADQGVRDTTPERREALEAAVGVLRAMTEQDMDEAPERVAGQSDRHERQEHFPERLVGDRLQRAALVGRLPANPESELDGQDPDHAVDHAARNETRA